MGLREDEEQKLKREKLARLDREEFADFTAEQMAIARFEGDPYAAEVTSANGKRIRFNRSAMVEQTHRGNVDAAHLFLSGINPIDLSRFFARLSGATAAPRVQSPSEIFVQRAAPANKDKMCFRGEIFDLEEIRVTMATKRKLLEDTATIEEKFKKFHTLSCYSDKKELVRSLETEANTLGLLYNRKSKKLIPSTSRVFALEAQNRKIAMLNDPRTEPELADHLVCAFKDKACGIGGGSMGVKRNIGDQHMDKAVEAISAGAKEVAPAPRVLPPQIKGLTLDLH